MIARRKIILYCTVAIILFLTSWALSEIWHDFRGEAFSGPAKQLDMPDEWKQQPVRYENWAENADLAVTLDQHLYPALLPLINKYARENNLKIAVNEGTCGISAGLLMRKAVDIAGFCCPPGGTDRYPDLTYHTLGIGSLAILVNPVNPVDDITFKQAQQIFQGKIHRWSELKTAGGRPGPDVPIISAARLHCKTRPGHWRLLLSDEDHFSARLRTVGSIQDVMFEVYNNDYAIAGFETLYMAHYRYLQGVKLKPLRIDGYSPDVQEYLVSGNYRIYHTYNLTAWTGESQKKKPAADLIDYLIRHADVIDASFGIVPSSSLRKAGWIFTGNELTGEPAIQHDGSS